MKRILCVLALSSLCSCSMFGGTDADGNKGLAVSRTSAILSNISASVSLYDINKDGVISNREWAPLALAIANEFWMESTRIVPETTSQPSK